MPLLMIFLCNLFMIGQIWFSSGLFTGEIILCCLMLIAVSVLAVKKVQGRLGRLSVSLGFFIFWAQGLVSLHFYNNFFAAGFKEFDPGRLDLVSLYIRELPFAGLMAVVFLAAVQYGMMKSSAHISGGILSRSAWVFVVLAGIATVPQVPVVVGFAQEQLPQANPISRESSAQKGLWVLNGSTDSIIMDNSIKDPVDIYVIQSESFFDIRRTGIRLTANPYVNFDALKTESLWGELGVPVQGGMTCNSEFEFITGVRAENISCVPFDDFIEEPICSIADKAGEAGFSTIGIHPNRADFYKRDKVYPLLGFGRFISLADFNTPETFGAWVADSAGFQRSLAETGENQNRSNLVFFVTVQNHGPFLVKTPDPIYPSGLSRDDSWSIRNLAGGHRASDQALGQFIETLRKQEKRSIVVLYGDHQPAATHDLYGSLPYFKDKDNAFKTEYFIWDSAQLLPKGKSDTNLLALGAYVRSLIPGNLSRNDKFLLSEYADAVSYLEKKNGAEEAVIAEVASSVRTHDTDRMSAYLK